MIRNIEPHLQDVAARYPVLHDSGAEHRLRVRGDADECVRTVFGALDRKPESLQHPRIEPLHIDVWRHAVYEAES